MQIFIKNNYLFIKYFKKVFFNKKKYSNDMERYET
jgi:hypothetical protein